MAAYIDLPYQAEYAKSGRASCKLCRVPIDKDTLRLAIMVQSPHFDGKVPNWHHFTCFWNRVRCTKTEDIHGFNNIRWEDQEKIKNAIEGIGSFTGTSKKASKSSSLKSKLSLGNLGAQYGDYKLEYAKSGRSLCRGCQTHIEKDALRMSKKDYTSEGALMYGPQDAWYHILCFNKLRDELMFPDSMDHKKVPGFKSLSGDDKKKLLQIFGKGKKQKRKAEVEQSAESTAEPVSKLKKEVDDHEDMMRQQNKLVWEVRDNLQSHLTTAMLKALLDYNGIQLPSGENKLLDCVSDAMVFGTPAQCPECGGQLRLSGSIDGYRCIGDVSGWTKCQYITDDPDRKEFLIPKKLIEIHYLSSYKYEARKRLFPKSSTRSVQSLQSSQSSGGSSQTIKIENDIKSDMASLSQPSTSSQPSASSSAAPFQPTSSSASTSAIPWKPLAGMKLSSWGKLSLKKIELKSLIEGLGGKLVDISNRNADFCVSDAAQVTNNLRHKVMLEANKMPAVDVEFLNAVSTRNQDFMEIFKKHLISPWPCSLEKVLSARINIGPKGTSAVNRKGFLKETPMMAKMVIKGGAAVDPLSELEYEAHVLQGRSKKDLYNSVLGLVDVAKGTNSFYKLQLLESDHGHQWWLFRAWGRVGTTIGGHKLEEYDEKEEAIDAFERLYHEKTGNKWKNRGSFVKVPHRFYPLDIDYGNNEDEEEEKKMKMMLSAGPSSSTLAYEVQELVRLIFDVENMRKAMLEFEIDLRKMPLGKLSKKQIESAYKVLSEAQELVINNGTNTHILDASNRFYTLIPHDFGLMKPPLLDNDDIIKTKVLMLDNLSDIEIAYNLLIGDSKGGLNVEAIDHHYAKLNTDINVMDKTSAEFSRICQYVKNTHAATHNDYDLDVLEVFTISRHGESKVYQPFKDLHNRMLLWHGSRLTNYAGILSQGLRIAPKEAPSTGYMFGKGIYFADMASKSANYCFTNKANPTGLMLLSEVALGNMHELTKASFIKTLPKGKHSVKGLGATAPNPKFNFVCEDGVVIPMGKGIQTRVKDYELLYNEYIVYDVAQVNIKYLLKLNFKYKSYY